MRLPLACLALTLAALTRAATVPEVPAVRFDLLPGGKVNVVVGARAYPMEAAKAAELRSTLEGLDLAGLRGEVGKLREALRAVDKARTETATKAKALERESGRVKAAEKEIAALEKRRADLESQIARAQRSGADTTDSLRSQLSGVNQRLAKENKDLARARELQAKAGKSRDAASAAEASATAEADRLGKAVEGRLEKVRAALRAAGVA